MTLDELRDEAGNQTLDAMEIAILAVDLDGSGVKELRNMASRLLKIQDAFFELLEENGFWMV